MNHDYINDHSVQSKISSIDPLNEDEYNNLYKIEVSKSTNILWEKDDIDDDDKNFVLETFQQFYITLL